MRNKTVFSLLVASLMASSSAFAQDVNTAASEGDSEAVVETQDFNDGDETEIAEVAEVSSAESSQAAPTSSADAKARAKPAGLRDISKEQLAYLSANPEACELFVYTAPNVVAVKKASGFAKFAAAALPVVAGSVLGNFAGPEGFKAAQILQDASSTTAQNVVRDRAADVPQSIYNAFRPEQQRQWLEALSVNTQFDQPTAPPIINGPAIPNKDAVAARYAVNGNRCINVINFDNIIFEHSEKYDKELAAVINTRMYHFNGKKTKPKEEVEEDYKGKLANFKVEQVEASPALIQELATVYSEGLRKAVKKFADKID